MKIDFNSQINTQTFGATIIKTEALNTIKEILNYNSPTNYYEQVIGRINQILPDNKDSVMFTKCEHDPENGVWKWSAEIFHKNKKVTFDAVRKFVLPANGYIKAEQILKEIVDNISSKDEPNHYSWEMFI